MIAIEAYRPEWPEQFASLGRVLRDVLGDLALRIDHIGSTSVPGLPAKDIIDVQVTTRALTTQLDEAVTCAEYERFADITRDHVPPGGPADPEQWSKWFYDQQGETPRVNRTFASRGGQISAMRCCFATICVRTRRRRRMGG